MEPDRANGEIEAEYPCTSKARPASSELPVVCGGLALPGVYQLDDRCESFDGLGGLGVDVASDFTETEFA